MTVQQLIDHLSRFDRNLEVIFDEDGNTWDCPIPELWDDGARPEDDKSPVAFFIN